jgi:hypothetical protein
VNPLRSTTGWAFAGRWAWWPVVIAILWAMPAVTTALYYVGPYARSGMADGVGRAELVDATRQVFVDALRPSNHAITPYVAGLLVALAATYAVGLGGLRRRACVGP